MASMPSGRHGRRPPGTPLAVLLLGVLLLSTLAPSSAIPIRKLATALSLSRALLARVANARAARGDFVGAARARRMAGIGAWSLSWDYLRHYAWGPRGGGRSASAAAYRLFAALSDAASVRSADEMVRWIRRHATELREALEPLLEAFRHEGPLRELVMDLKWELEDGALLKDCLVIGAKDLKGLLSVAKDLFSSSSHDDFSFEEL